MKDSKVHKEIVTTIYEGAINHGHIPQSLNRGGIIELIRALIMIEQHGVYDTINPNVAHYLTCKHFYVKKIQEDEYEEPIWRISE